MQRHIGVIVLLIPNNSGFFISTEIFLKSSAHYCEDPIVFFHRKYETFVKHFAVRSMLESSADLFFTFLLTCPLPKKELR